MTGASITFTHGRGFDGERLHEKASVQFDDGVLVAVTRDQEHASGHHVVNLGGDILSPGYVDLQVNGGGGVMFNDDPSVETLSRISSAHQTLGTSAILPTLITDIPAKTTAAISAVHAALQERISGIAGLHLEGPHLSIARHGAHDPALIRKMDDADLQELLAAKSKIPILKVTIAPESVSIRQVRQLVEAGILVSLGHSDADFETCCAYADAGASCVTHLFNAMSQLQNRAPGLVGAALDEGRFSAGLIADGIHVHPASLRAAWAGKRGPGQIFLVSDAMAVAGTDNPGFKLEGRQISRLNGRLTLEDGTLAGADLDLTKAVNVLVNNVGVDLADAIRAATTGPADLIGLQTGLIPGQTRLTDVIRISSDLTGVRSLGAPADQGAPGIAAN